jgi:hypothetical protein
MRDAQELALFELPAAPVVRRGLAPEPHRPPRRGGLPRNAPTMNACPAPGCRIWVPVRRLACSAHWFSLPAQLRKGINDTYRRDVRRHLALYREAIRLLHLNAQREDPRT